MESKITSATFSSSSSDTSGYGRGGLWASLEQDFDEADELKELADFGTLRRMLIPALAGMSAVSVLSAECSYTSFLSGTASIFLDFFVWPSDLDLDYTLTANLGTISGPTRTRQAKSFDIIVDGSNYSELDFIFDGRITPSMPIFTPLGEDLGDKVDFEMDNAVMVFPQAVTSVFRANGDAIGYKHTLTAQFTKASVEGYNKVEDVALQVTCTWTDEAGEIQSTTLQLKIPDCATKALEFCEGDEDSSSVGETKCSGSGKCNGQDTLVVYYNTCEYDTVLDTVWRKDT